jgi:arginine N-succinyltransferase
MFFIRPAKPEDAPTLLKLAKMVHFINLPADADIINNKIARSMECFAGERLQPHEQLYMFVLEDGETGNPIGTSSIIPCNSWPGHPYTFLKVRKREHYSDDLQIGQVHITLQLEEDVSGPTEIGGLILFPNYRGHKEKLGSLLSLIRFNFIGLNRKKFDDRLVAEMMGALTPDSNHLLWEYLGRRFINLTYTEADRFCQHSKEFMISLFPRGEIYATLLPAEARSLIGKVGAETEPAKAMLENLGFTYDDQIDPFDGGPYLEAKMSDIALISGTREVKLAATTGDFGDAALLSFTGEYGFRGVRCAYAKSSEGVAIPAEVARTLGAKLGDRIGFTPLPQRSTNRGRGELNGDHYDREADKPRRSRSAKRAAASSSSKSSRSTTRRKKVAP